MTEDMGGLLSAPLPKESPSPAAEVPAVVRIDIAVVAKLNLADFQNAVPALREIAVVNETAFDISELTLTVTSEPPFLKARTWSLDAVGAGKTYHLNDLDVQSDGSLLSRLTEAEPSTLRFELRSRKAPDILIAEHQCVVELLACRRRSKSEPPGVRIKTWTGFMPQVQGSPGIRWG